MMRHLGNPCGLGNPDRFPLARSRLVGFDSGYNVIMLCYTVLLYVI